MLLTKEIGIKWILESFVIEEKCKQDSKVLTYSLDKLQNTMLFTVSILAEEKLLKIKISSKTFYHIDSFIQFVLCCFLCNVEVIIKSMHS